jgi:hypothetical protein
VWPATAVVRKRFAPTERRWLCKIVHPGESEKQRPDEFADVVALEPSKLLGWVIGLPSCAIMMLEEVSWGRSDRSSMNETVKASSPTGARPGADLLAAEDRIVAELEQLGIRYLARENGDTYPEPRPPAIPLADLMRQPSARVREAVIAVLLLHPAYAQAVPAALAQLSAAEQLVLRLYFTASVILQREYAGLLRPHVTEPWQWLPDLFSRELGVPRTGAPKERLRRLGAVHRARSGSAVNWTGTYENVACKLIRRCEMERQWSQ